MLCDNKEKDKLTFYQGALEKHERERATFFFFLNQHLHRVELNEMGKN